MRLRDICELLHVTEEQALRLVEKEGLPARRAGGEWRFVRQEVLLWLSEHHLPGLSEYRWRQIELGHAGRAGADPLAPVVTAYLPPGGVVLDVAAKTNPSVLRELVRAADGTGLCYDPEALADGLRVPEERRKRRVRRGCGGLP